MTASGQRSDRRIGGSGYGCRRCMLLAIEFASSPRIAPVPPPSKVDAYLARKPPAVIVELPLLSAIGIWGSLDWRYMYQGLPHFQKMLNGYSGYAPASFYRDARADEQVFPTIGRLLSCAAAKLITS